jgi:heat shock protein HslJ
MKKLSLVYWIIAFVCLTLISCKNQSSSQQKPDASLTNTRWKMVELNGKPVVTAEKDLVMTLRPEGNKIDGFAGCNGFFGQYTIDKNVIKAGELVSTRMMCPQIEVENQFMNILRSNPEYRIKGDTLELLSAGKVAAKFEALYL